MKLYIKQKVFSWGDKFRVFDECGNEVLYVEGEIFSWGKKLHVYQNGIEMAFIHQKVFSFLPKYYVSRNGVDVAEIVKEISFFRPVFSVNGMGWRVEGDFFSHEYDIQSGARGIAHISKHWFTWGDTYEINVADGEDSIMALCVVLVIDAVLAQQSNSSND